MHHSMAEATLKRVALIAGLAALACGTLMSFAYGSAMSYTHGVLLSLLAVGAAIAFPGADMMRARGRRMLAGILTVAGVACMVGEYTTHFGYTVGSRATDTQQTLHHNVNLQTIQENRRNEQANLDMWRKQLSDLMAANAWATTVKADGLRDELATLKDRMAKEEQGQRGRKAGKGQEFERLQNQANAVSARIATIEQADELSKRIEATQRILDRKTETATATPYKSSKIINQSIGFAQISTGEIEPSAIAIGWTQIILGATIALFTTFLAPLFLQIALPDLSKPHGEAPTSLPTSTALVSQEPRSSDEWRALIAQAGRNLKAA